MPTADVTTEEPSRGNEARRRAEERLLLRRYHETRDPLLREELTERFMPLARSFALRYRGGGEPVEDLVQVACLGLLKAIDRFDPDRATDFVAFAAPTILGELRHHFRDRSWSVRLPRSLQERSMRIAEVTQEISGQEQRPASLAEVAVHCDLEEHEVRYWTHALGVSREELEAAVREVGVSANAVRQKLGKA